MRTPSIETATAATVGTSDASNIQNWEEETMQRRISAGFAILLGSITFPVAAAAGEGHHGGPPVKCAELAAQILDDHGKQEVLQTGFPGKGLDVGPRSRVLAATSVIVPAGVDPPAQGGPFPSYCEVNLTLFPAINVRVGLPLSGADGGTGGADGAWNGKLQNLGGGGFAGSVGSVRGPIRAGYVGSSTDTGHGEAWCEKNSNHVGLNTPGPNPVPFGTGQCGLGGGAFVLDQGTPPRLIKWQVKDFITDGILAQTRWAMRLSRMYYDTPIRRNYWNGCSTGGRQGFEMAQRYGELFDGFLVGAPAMNWNRFQTGEFWPPVVVNNLLGDAGLPAAKYNAANAAAVAACDGLDGVVDGLISEPRRCTYDATQRLCVINPGDPTCLTPAEADAINKIWDGPRNLRGQRLWGGIPRGVSFGTLLFPNPFPTGPGKDPFPFILTWQANWVHENPFFDWKTIRLTDFGSEFQLGSRKFADWAATDDPDLDAVRRNGAKIVHYHGLADPLIVPFGSHNYVSRVFDRYGVHKTQSFMRSFFYPGNGHCGGGAPGAPLIDGGALLNALVNWVENGVAPDHIVAHNAAKTRSRKVCMYPNEAGYIGYGNTDDEASFQCIAHPKEPADLRADSQTARQSHEAP
jgi:feruloyl esterase